MVKDMKLLFFFLSLVCLWGCSVFQNSTKNIAPRLLLQQPLPAVSSKMQPGLKLSMDLYVKTDGTVGAVKLLNTSGDKNWDSLAIESIKKWQFTPAVVDDKDVGIWMRQTVVIEYMDPQIIPLAEIVCPTLEEADSVYEALDKGNDFGDLAVLHSIAKSKEQKGNLGKIDIRRYPENIRQELIKLQADEYTSPMEYGNNYIILKRLDE